MSSSQRHAPAESHGVNASLSRPTSVQLEQLQAKHSTGRNAANNRPLSEQIPGNYKSPEAQAIDKWFEDLSYYERTLEEMSITTLDDSFKEEMAAIENWFKVLSDPERTTCLYTLLKGTTPLQIKFFITVLTQIAAKDANKDPLYHSVLRSPSGARPSSVVSNTNHSEDVGRLFARPNSQRLSTEYNIRSHTLLHSSSQDDFSDDALSSSGRHHTSAHNNPSSSIHRSPVKHDEEPTYNPSSDWKPATSRSASLEPSKPFSKPVISGQLPPRPPYDKRHSPTTPAAKIHHSYTQVINQGRPTEIPTITPRQIGRSLPRPRKNVHDDEFDSGGANLVKPRDKLSTDSVNLNEIQDIPTWFRSLRLHKYTCIFENDDWRSIIRMTEDQLIERGVAALGARRKMLKVFEAARNELEEKKIQY